MLIGGLNFVLLLFLSRLDRSAPSEEAAAAAAAAASFPRIRQCCSRTERFDPGSGVCEPRVDRTESLSKLAINRGKSDGRDYLKVRNGDPVCDGSEVLVLEGKIDGRKFAETRDVRSEASEKFCMDSASTTGLSFLVGCREDGADFCARNICLRKCCQEESAIYREKGCLPRSGSTLAEWRGGVENLTNAFGDNNTETKMLNETDYGVVAGLPCLGGMWNIPPGKWRLEATGRTFEDESHLTFGNEESCLEMTEIDGEWRLHAFVCFPENLSGPIERRELNRALMWVSCVFLLGTFLVYAYLPNLQNLHGKTVMAHIGSLFVGYLMFPMLSIQPLYENKLFCKSLGFATLFFLLSVFLWLNVLCFDIWWKFGSSGRSDHSNFNNGRKKGRKRFLFYCLFAWGVAFLVTIFAAAADRLEFLPFDMRPGFGLRKCWFVGESTMVMKNERTEPRTMTEFVESGENSYGELLFFVGPISLLLTTNLIFYILTARRCTMVKAELRKYNGTNSSRTDRFNSDRTKLALNVKLFVGMGVTWIFEVVSFIVRFTTSNHPWQQSIFYVTDTVNCLQGFFIFSIFVLKPRVYEFLKERWNTGDGRRPGLSARISRPLPTKGSTITKISTVSSSDGIDSSL